MTPSAFYIGTTGLTQEKETTSSCQISRPARFGLYRKDEEISLSIYIAQFRNLGFYEYRN